MEELLANDEIFYLSEMMNYPGVLFADNTVMQKIELAKKYNKPVDGHAPGLRGADARKYIEAGVEGAVTISTDHECFTLEEALDKLKFGMMIIIREGSAAKNFEALHTLIASHNSKVMFCSDDKHPDDLIVGHINQLAARAVAKGYDLFDVLQCACINPKLHYNLKSGILRPGDAADFIIVEDLKNFSVTETYINGECVMKNKATVLPPVENKILNNFSTNKKHKDEFTLAAPAEGKKAHVIEAIDGQLITNHLQAEVLTESGYVISDTANDILKITVVNR